MCMFLVFFFFFFLLYRLWLGVVYKEVFIGLQESSKQPPRVRYDPKVFREKGYISDLPMNLLDGLQ
jgi:hypothetical protein